MVTTNGLPWQIVHSAVIASKQAVCLHQQEPVLEDLLFSVHLLILLLN